MPLPLAIAGAAISGGSNLIGGGIDAIATGIRNRKSMNFTREMYQRQFDDNLRLWHMQNEYNSPVQQMQRLKEAGLNPHLVYGGSGNAGSASSISAPSAGSPGFESSNVGRFFAAAGNDGMAAYMNTQMQAAQLNNLEEQRNVLQQEAILKAAQTASTIQNTERSVFDLGVESELREYSLEARKLAVRGLEQTMDIALRKDMRDAIMTSSSIQEIEQRTLNLIQERANKKMQEAHTYEDMQRIIAQTAEAKQRVRLLRKENIIKQLDSDLAKGNVRPADPVWYRVLQNIYGSAAEFFKNSE